MICRAMKLCKPVTLVECTYQYGIVFSSCFKATIVQSSLQAANIILQQAVQSTSRVLIEVAQQNRTVYDVNLKYNEIVHNVGNASRMIVNASSSGRCDGDL